MKSQSWIEVLLTLGIFIYLFIYVFTDFISGLNSYTNYLSDISKFQGLYLDSFYFSNNYNENQIYNITGIPFSYSYTPSVIFLSTNYYVCNNCVEIYYNNAGSYINIYESSNSNITSFLSFFIFSNNNINYSLSDGSIYCSNYYNISIYSIYYRSLLFCDLYLYQNGNINISSTYNSIILSNYLSLLDLYNGDRIIGTKRSFGISSNTVSIGYFSYVNNSIEYINLYS
ncbi:hypothetical protein MJ1_0432 [Nanobdella aerobiophila]|uniref:Uncharacterized protein n=1 Tax=Nanobdella aerobiophila TaxID=2586965 RepID=A0A915SKE5_9ARCH|nr:hypothetical protein [Nanobdella aerobiophila]BBL45593.1 hypothetical protein MJ1_0432 [Nanobdella aerobiophila]